MKPASQSTTNSFEQVIRCLQIEADAIGRAAQKLDADNVERAFRLLAETDGKIVVTGVGKSGVIAQKIAQTLTSTGTVSIFLHPSDALHGSLGVIAENDVVIALSNSGETDEILAILPALRLRNVSVVAIVGNIDSSLARHSDAVLDASVDKEACPLNLAPTTSTTVALAIGDAIAMALMESRGLTAEDFAANHPAGRLGKRLTLQVADLMHESPNVSPESSFIEVVKAISKHTLGAVNVIDQNQKLVGIVTDGDLRRAIEKTDATLFHTLTAIEMMTPNPVTANLSMLAYDALKLMENRASQISVLPVLDESETCVGLLRLHDIVRSGI